MIRSVGFEYCWLKKNDIMVLIIYTIFSLKYNFEYYEIKNRIIKALIKGLFSCFHIWYYEDVNREELLELLDEVEKIQL